MQSMTVREYAAKEGITIGTAYRRIWEGQVKAEQFYGRWLISPSSEQSAHKAAEERALVPARA
jgi:hypothetical protein